MQICDICDIAYTQRTCPCCKAEEKIEELFSEIHKLETKINKLEKGL